MNWFLVAKQSVRESFRSRELLSLVALFGLMFGAVGLLVGNNSSGNATDDLVDILLVASGLIVPIAGLMLGQPAISAKREDGRLRLLFGQPISRTALVLGSYVGNVIVLAASLCAGVAAAVVGYLALGGGLDVQQIGAFLLGSIGLGVAYLGFSIAASSASRTTRWATFNMLGVYLLFIGIWRMGPHAVLFFSNGMTFPGEIPGWADLVAGLSPSVAFERLFGFDGIEFFEASSYTGAEFSVVVLAAWALVFPMIGLLRFRSADL